MKRIADFLTFAAIVAGGFLAQRAFGADGEVAAGVASAFDSLSQYPLFLTFVSWAAAEIGTRRWPTVNPTSTFFLLRQIFHACSVGFTALERVADYLYQHPFAQKQRQTADPAAAPVANVGGQTKEPPQ